MYGQLSSHGYIHKTVIHDSNFVDSESGAHTHSIEWCRVEAKAW